MSAPLPAAFTATPWEWMLDAFRRGDPVYVVASLHFRGHDYEGDTVKLRDFGLCMIDEPTVTWDQGIITESLVIRPVDNQGRYGDATYTLRRTPRSDDRPKLTPAMVDGLAKAVTFATVSPHGFTPEAYEQAEAGLKALRALLPPPTAND